jgi:hypothetical protein
MILNGKLNLLRLKMAGPVRAFTSKYIGTILHEKPHFQPMLWIISVDYLYCNGKNDAKFCNLL